MSPLIISVVTIACFHQVHAEHWRTLLFDKGDVLACVINPVAKHILLATSNSTVAHFSTKGKFNSSTTAYLREDSWISYHLYKGDEQSNCRVMARARDPDRAVSRAHQDIERHGGQRIHYDVFNCNCEHWVSRWANGYVFSLQSSQTASSDCGASFASVKTTNGWSCDSECTGGSDGIYYCYIIGIPPIYRVTKDSYNYFLNKDPMQKHCSPTYRTTYKGASCVGECRAYLNYYYCYTTDYSDAWDYCGPTQSS